MKPLIRNHFLSPCRGCHDPRAERRWPSRLWSLFLGLAVLIVSALLASGCAPVITGINPTSAKPGDVVVIHGKRLGGEVRFAGRPASEVVVHDDTSVSATVPEGVSSGSITVANDWGVAVSPVRFCALLCWFGLDTDTVDVDFGGGEQVLDVEVPPSCYWFGKPNKDWIEVTSPYVGRVPHGWSIGAKGDGELRFAVAPICSERGDYQGPGFHSGCRPPRSGEVTLVQTFGAPSVCPAGATVLVDQEGITSAPDITWKKCVTAGPYGSRFDVTLRLGPVSPAVGESFCVWMGPSREGPWENAYTASPELRELEFLTGSIDSGEVWIHVTVCFGTSSDKYLSPPSNVVQCMR